MAEKRQETRLKTFVLMSRDGVKRMVFDRIGVDDVMIEKTRLPWVSP